MNTNIDSIKKDNSNLEDSHRTMKSMGIGKICVIGMGYIGLPTAALLANRGGKVRGVEIDPQVIATVNSGKTHIVEPDLDTFVQSGVKSGNLKACEKPSEADVFLICVPTPFVVDENNEPQPDLSYVQQAAMDISPFVRAGNAVILESTSPVGTTEMLSQVLQKEGIDTDTIHIAYCPERVLPGRIIIELVENDRIVGGITPESTRYVASFYRQFVVGDVLETDCRTAEMCKLVENSSRDVQIAFANELSMLCDKLNIDVWQLIKLANRHPRVNILKPGVGVGGHCIAVDPWFIISQNPNEAKLLRSAREVNRYKTLWIIEKAKNEILLLQSETDDAPLIGILGLAFKPDIDDLRESPALKIALALKEEGYNLLVCEPNIWEHRDFQLATLEEILNKSNIIFSLVAHREFVNLQDSRIIDFSGLQTV